MTDLPACPGCGALVSPDDEHDCEVVRCWDCGMASPGRVFCRTCGAWLGASASGPATADERRTVHRAVPAPVPLAITRTRARGRGRRIALAAAVLLVVGVGSLVGLASFGAGSTTPGGAMGVAPSATPSPPGLDPVVPTRPVAAVTEVVLVPTVTGGSAATPTGTAVPGARSPAAPVAQRAAPEQPGRAASDDGWLCDGSRRLVARVDGRWRIARVTFRAGDGFDRVILRLARAGSRRGGASLQARIAGGGRGLAIDLAGVSSGLELRGFRPSGLRLVRSLSVSGAGADRARIGIVASAAACARVRVPAWQTGGTAVSSAELVVDLRR